MLNCITINYKDLWDRYSHLLPEYDQLISSYIPIKDEKFWNKDTAWRFDKPLKCELARRQALLEIDVLVAIEMGLSLKELLNIYIIQFPVLHSNELKIFYDNNGRRVSTNAKNDYLNDFENGDVKEVYDDYHTPFLKCDRVKDYEKAWEYFKEKSISNV